jgi:hypothetical protein
VAYLVIIIVVAVAGITRITLQQRREHKLHLQNDYRTSLEKVATQPLARPDDGPRRRWELAGWTDRKKTREAAPAAQRSSKREPAQTAKATRKKTVKETPRRRERRPETRSRQRARTQPAHRPRVSAARREAEVDWFEDLRSRPGEISLDHDLAPTKLPVNSRNGGQPSTRGRLQPEFHANIHPAHLPPTAAHDLEPRSDDGNGGPSHDLQAEWEAFAESAVAGEYRRSALSRRRAG